MATLREAAPTLRASHLPKGDALAQRASFGLTLRQLLETLLRSLIADPDHESEQRDVPLRGSKLRVSVSKSCTGMGLEDNEIVPPTLGRGMNQKKI